MTTKEYLNRARGVEAEVSQLRRMKQDAYKLATRRAVGEQTPPAKVVDAYAEYSRKIDAKIAELLDARQVVENVIERLDDRRYRQLLRARYIEGKTWEQIAVDMNYSYSQVVKYLHPAALVCVKDAIE